MQTTRIETREESAHLFFLDGQQKAQIKQIKMVPQSFAENRHNTEKKEETSSRDSPTSPTSPTKKAVLRQPKHSPREGGTSSPGRGRNPGPGRGRGPQDGGHLRKSFGRGPPHLGGRVQVPPWIMSTSSPTLPEGFDPNESSAFMDAPSNLPYDDISRLRILDDLEGKNNKKGWDEETTQSEQENFEKELSKQGIQKNVILDMEEHKNRRISDISLSGESYIMDLANQKENREKDLQEMALDEALGLYKTAIEEEGQDEQLFLKLLAGVQKDLKVKMAKHYAEQDDRLGEALEEELKRREELADKELEEEEEQYKWSSFERVSQILSDMGDWEDVDIEDFEDYDEEDWDTGEFDENENEQEGNPNEMEAEDGTVTAAQAEGKESDTSGSMSTVDLNNENRAEAVPESKQDEKRPSFFSSLFKSKSKPERPEMEKQGSKYKQLEDGTADRPRPGSEVFRQLQQMEEGSDCQDVPTDSKRKLDPPPSTKQVASTVGNSDVEQGFKGQKARKKMANWIPYGDFGKAKKLILVGVAVFFLFDIVMLVLFFLGR